MKPQQPNHSVIYYLNNEEFGLSSQTSAIGHPLRYSWTSLVAQLVKNPPAMWKTWVRSLGWEDLLDKGGTTHSSILGRTIPWTI